MSLLRAIMLVSLLVLAVEGWAREIPVPDFKDYPVKGIYTGKPVKVALGTPEARQFRTRLRDAAKQPADFSGENVLALWGCGTSCVYGAAVNLRTGHVVFLPGSVCCNGEEEDRIQYRKDSRLWVAYGLLNEEEPYGKHYYEFTGSEFRLIRTVPMENTYMKDFGPRVSRALEEAVKLIEQKQKQE